MGLASRGLRDMDDGPEAMEAAEAEAVRAQARKVQRDSLTAAALITALGWFLL